MAVPFNSKTNYVLNVSFIALSTIRPVICWFKHLKDIKTLERHSAFWQGNPLIKYFTPIALVPFVVQDGITNKREYLGEVDHPHSQFCRRLSVSSTPSSIDIPKNVRFFTKFSWYQNKRFVCQRTLIKEISRSSLIHPLFY